MGAEFFTIKKIPDLTLAKYSAEESGGVDEVIHQHNLFYRQLNRKGLLFDEMFHLIYLYDPSENPGNRISVFFRADSKEHPVCMDEFINASPISPFFEFIKENPKTNPTFSCKATLVKHDGYVMSSFPEKNISFYTVDKWKANEKARLIGLFRMMQKLNRPVAYAVTIKAADLSEKMRESFRTQIQYIRTLEKGNVGSRDENAEQTLRLYDKFLESLRENPHFLCRISAFANNEALAKMLLDSAASEAVEEGSYRIVCEKGSFKPLVPELEISEMCLEDTPRGMKLWNSIFTLKEMTPFSMLPVLYPGESIELPKESAPVYEKTGLYLGKDNNGYDVYFPLSLLPKHALLAGVPGSGKTYSMLHLSSQLAGKENNIPILVLEPAKKEYRALAKNKDLPNLTVFSPGGTGAFPLRINPFEFPIGCKLSEHITNLYQVFEGAFDLEGVLPIFIQDGIEEVYRDHGWYSFEVNDGKHTYPTTQELYDKVEALMEEKDYDKEIKGNLTTCLQTRVGSLLKRELGNVFNVAESTIGPEEWLTTSCVIELESLGKYAGNFLTLLLLTIIREMLRQNPRASKEKPRHVIFLEEAHNIIGPNTEGQADKMDPKAAATKYIVDMLAEVRALGEAIVIADQLPTALAPQVTKNTSLKIGHRITAMDDRQLLAETMSADGVQMERMAAFQPGHALCVYENVQKPFEIQIAKYGDKQEDSEPPTNDELLSLLKDRPIYQTVIDRDIAVMMKRFEVKKKPVRQRKITLMECKRVLAFNRKSIQDSPENIVRSGIVSSDESQYFRNLDVLNDSWMELILEMNDYAKNIVKDVSKIEPYLLAEVKDFIFSIKELLADYPDAAKPFVNRAIMSIQKEMDWLGL